MLPLLAEATNGRGAAEIAGTLGAILAALLAGFKGANYAAKRRQHRPPASTAKAGHEPPCPQLAALEREVQHISDVYGTLAGFEERVCIKIAAVHKRVDDLFRELPRR